MASWNELFEKLLKQTKLLDQQNRVTARSLQTLSEALEEVGDSATIVEGNIGAITRNVDHFRKVVNGLEDGLEKLTQNNRRYQTSAKLALRGTSLLTDGTTSLRTAYLGLETASNRIAQASGAGIEEATAFTANLTNAVKQAGSRVSITADELDAMGIRASQLGKFAGMGTEQIGEASAMLVREMGLSAKGVEAVMTDTAAAAKIFGINGTKVFSSLQEHLDQVQSLDVKGRQAYLQKQIQVAGLQEKAAVNFGKHTDRLTGRKGIDALVSAAVLAQTSGIDQAKILRAQATPQDAESQKLLLQANTLSAEALAEGAMDLRQAVKEGRVADLAQLQKDRQNDARIAALSQFSGGSGDVDEALSSRAALSRLRNTEGYSAEMSRAAQSISDHLPELAERGYTLDEKQNQHRAWFEKSVLQLGSEGMDKASDLYGVVSKWTETIKFTQDLGAAAIGAAVGLIGLGKSVLQLGQLFSRLNGLGGVGGGIGLAFGNFGKGLAAAAAPMARFAAQAGLAFETLGTVTKLATKAGREQMWSAVEMASEADGAIGYLGNFAQALVSPTESLAKMGMVLSDLPNLWEQNRDAEKAKHQQRDDNYFKHQKRAARQKELAETEDGKRIYEAYREANAAMERMAKSGGVGYLEAPKIAGAILEGQERGLGSAEAIAELERINNTLKEKGKSQDPADLAETVRLKAHLQRLEAKADDQRIRLEDGKGSQDYALEAKTRNLEEKNQREAARDATRKERERKFQKEMKAAGLDSFALPSAPTGFSESALAGSLTERLVPDLGRRLAPSNDLLKEQEKRSREGMEKALAELPGNIVPGLSVPIVPELTRPSPPASPDFSAVASPEPAPPPSAGTAPDMRAIISLLTDANRLLEDLVSSQGTEGMVKV